MITLLQWVVVTMCLVLSLVNALQCTVLIDRQSRRHCHAVMAMRVALTREKGANDKLRGLLEGIDCYELPCIMFDKGEDIDKLEGALSTHDLIVITSPQAASVLLDEWKQAQKPAIKVVTVGSGSSKPLVAAGLVPLFEPSDSTAETLAEELPIHLGSTVLYPSSALADNKLVSGLERRGFKVTRLNTYTTVPSVWSEEDLQRASSVDIVTFASPSAIKTWVDRVGNTAKAVVIGPTSAVAAKKYGFKEVFSPVEGSKGIQPWADLIRSIASHHIASHPRKEIE